MASTDVNLKGTLYLCATPIGNMEDITLRVLRILKEADVIAAEDTRHTRKILSHFGIDGRLVSYHQHNEKSRGSFLLGLLAEGQNVALVSDAGMPGISDPGEIIVREAVQQGFPVTVLPGPVAAVTALVCSGLSTGSFVFEGFLPSRKKERRDRLEFLKEERRTMIFYEAPHRLLKTLQDMAETLGNRRVAVARELTKKFEEVIRGGIEDAIGHFTQTAPRGEFCLVVEGAGEANSQGAGERQEGEPLTPEISAEISQLVEQGHTAKDAAREIARKYGLSKNDAYRLYLESKKDRIH